MANRLPVSYPGSSYRLQLCRLCHNGGGFHCRAAIQTYKEAESSVLEFMVVGDLTEVTPTQPTPMTLLSSPYQSEADQRMPLITVLSTLCI